MAMSSASCRRQRRWFSRPERMLIDLLIDFLALKRNQIVGRQNDE